MISNLTHFAVQKHVKSGSSYMISRTLHFLCETNCWGLILGLDQLDYSLLSPLTTLFQEFHSAQQMRMTRFSLGGIKTRNLGFDTAIFFKTRLGRLLTDNFLKPIYYYYCKFSTLRLIVPRIMLNPNISS